jgi:Xaa-Pro aminopeptidase
MEAMSTTDASATDAQSPSPKLPDHRSTPRSEAFRAFIADGWAPRPSELPARLVSAPWAAARREALSRQYPGERLVVPAGQFRVRSNDTDYRFRPHSAFAHLTGLGTDREPDAVLVLEPRTGADGRRTDGHDAVLYLRPRAERDTEEFYASARYGELWVGVRQSLVEMAAETGLATAHLDEARDVVTKDLGADGVTVRLVRGTDAPFEAALAAARRSAAIADDDALAADVDLARVCAELRLVKDDWELDQLREAVAATARGFEDIVRQLPQALAGERGERVVEGVFGLRARGDGNAVGYDTIAASGSHACTLHWIRNDGPVREGDLILVDAGVEVDSLYTADVTRTLPVSGTFSPTQRMVYQAVLDAADAVFAIVRPGVRFSELNEAAMAVVADRLHTWGLLPGTVEQALDPEGQFHRRWLVHGVSHHLGLDVHDCAKARREMYDDGILEAGMVFTIEPGLYFREEDLLAPAELRGIGVRIEDDVLVTADGYENLSAVLPRTPDEIEAWMAELRGATDSV